MTITGHNFTGSGHSLVTKVMFGTRRATNLHVRANSRMTVRSPKGSGTVHVRVTTRAGTSAARSVDRYTYRVPVPVPVPVAPAVTSLSPTTGSSLGGTLVTITGSRFACVTAVMFGTSAAFFLPSSSTSILAVAPAGTGVVDVTVSTAAGTSATVSADQYIYSTLPTVTGLSPSTGSAVGGTTVTITGTDFTGATAVKFGTTAATGVVVVSATTITAVAPAGTGVVDLTVTTGAGTSVPVGYTYAP
jgi:hypothetical protein